MLAEKLMQFNVFGEVRVKPSSIIVNGTALNSDGQVINEIEVIDPGNTVIDAAAETDPIRFIFATSLTSARRYKVVRHQVAGPSMTDTKMIDRCIKIILRSIAKHD